VKEEEQRHQAALRLQRLHRRLESQKAAGPQSQKIDAGPQSRTLSRTHSYEIAFAIERQEGYEDELKEESADLIVVSTANADGGGAAASSFPRPLLPFPPPRHLLTPNHHPTSPATLPRPSPSCDQRHHPSGSVAQ